MRLCAGAGTEPEGVGPEARPHDSFVFLDFFISVVLPPSLLYVVGL